MLDIIKNSLLTLLLAIIPALVQKVLIGKTTLEYVLSTRGEKKKEQLFIFLFLSVMLAGIMIFLRIISLSDLLIVDIGAEMAHMIANISVMIYLFNVLCVIGFAYIAEKRTKDMGRKIRAIFSYILFFSAIGFVFYKYKELFLVNEIVVYLFIAGGAVFVLSALAFDWSSIDRALIYYEEKTEGLTPQEAHKKIYVYHKIEENYMLCGEDLAMTKPTKVIKIEELLQKGL